MKFRQLILTAFVALGLTANATNEKQTVEQVNDAIQLTTEVDYIITSGTPFTTTGSIDITNTEHAVLILSNVKPSQVLAKWIDCIYINGEKAVDGENCQVKMYNRGAIVFPYAKDIAPLTCYTEKNFEGEACSDYSEGHNGGFMKTLTEENLNNKIRSFKLKRGYMVTFAIGTGGWGYSRCFIADHEDLEVATLPNILDQKISSYRIFKWFNARKAGIGDSNDKDAISKMNLSWCYRMWPDPQGLDYLPDTEYVPHHYKESWPGAAELGSKEFSCHMKTNNEPGNSADEEPCSVADILANWESLMRTGMRLLSPSSHDGSMWHLKDVIDSIDARGWRCDILDLHCYWTEGQFTSGNLGWYSSNYGKGRPIWISEWIWGASWNKNGCFGNGVTDATILNQTKNILNTLNSTAIIERYAYWNSESKGRIYEGGVTTLGEAYGATDDGLGYNPSLQFIPRETRLEAPKNVNCTYNRTSGVVSLSWADPNWELSTDVAVQCKRPGTNTFTTIATLKSKDKNSAGDATFNYAETVSEPGAYTYRIRTTAYTNKTFTTEEVTVNVAPAQGTNEFQYGKLALDNLDENTIYYSEAFSEAPCVFMGTLTNKNSQLYAGNVTARANNKNYFTYQLFPWQTNKAQLSNNEEMPFLALKAGNYKYGHLDCEVGVIDANKASGDATWTDTTEVVFNQSFPEGVTPVVLTEMRNPGYTSSTATQKATTLSPRIFDVTNTGFKCIIYSEDASERKIALSKKMCYFAITPGFATVDEENGILIAAGHGIDSQIFGSSLRDNLFYVQVYDTEGDSIKNEPLYLYQPTIFTALQTNNYPTTVMLRRTDLTEKDGNNVTWTTGTRVKRILDHNIEVDGTTIPSTTTSDKYSAYFDNLGWVAITTYTEGGSDPTGIAPVPAGKLSSSLCPRVVNGRIYVDGVATFEVYSITGEKVPFNAVLPSGIYVVKANGKSAKVLVL